MAGKKVLEMLAREGIEAQETPFSKSGIRLNGRLNLRDSELLENGLAGWLFPRASSV